MTETFNLNRDQIIQRAFNILNVYESNETPSAADINMASDFLNIMVKHWAAQGIHLFERRVGYLFVQYNQNNYLLESSSTDHFTENYNQSTLTASYNTGATSIIVANASSFTTGDNIGIVLDTGYLYWTTISNLETNTITLAQALPSHVTLGAQVYDYTSNFDKPLKIHRGFRRDSLSNTDIPMFIDSSSDYLNQSVKFDLGQPVELYYDIQVASGNFYLWPTPSIVTDIIGFEFDKKIEDFIYSNDLPDFPNEWLRALIFGLAVDIAPAFGKYTELNYLQPIAASYLKEVKDFDQEQVDLNFVIKKYPYGAR